MIPMPEVKVFKQWEETDKRQHLECKSISKKKLDLFDSFVSHVKSSQQSAHFKGWEKAIVDAVKARLDLQANIRSREIDTSNSSSDPPKRNARGSVLSLFVVRYTVKAFGNGKTRSICLLLVRACEYVTIL